LLMLATCQCWQAFNMFSLSHSKMDPKGQKSGHNMAI
jgi:hypothetical protein